MSIQIDRLLETMARLRDPENGCPWDRKQTFATIVPHTIEETYEVADAVERQDLHHLKEELGDLLFQVVFLARIAEEMSLFNFNDVADVIVDKLIRRHPHVFGDKKIRSEDELSATWEAIKAQERRNKAEVDDQPVSHLDGISAALPALIRAVKLQARAAKVGFDWPEVKGVLEKVDEELHEVRQEIMIGGSHQRIENEVGDLLLACANLARHVSVEPEAALRRANHRFETRFRYMEALLLEQGSDFKGVTPAELDKLWEQAKKEAAPAKAEPELRV